MSERYSPTVVSAGARMIKLDRPLLGAKEVFTACISRVRDQDLRHVFDLMTHCEFPFVEKMRTARPQGEALQDGRAHAWKLGEGS